MSDLVEKLRAATGPSSDLDIAIFRVLNPKYAGKEWQPYGVGLRHVNDSSDARCLPPPEATPGRYTWSIDAALTLVPEGWYWSLCGYSDTHKPIAYIVPEMGKTPWPKWVDDIEGATPAIALCIAALMAREVAP